MVTVRGTCESFWFASFLSVTLFLVFFFLIYICNLHVLNHLLFIFICKLHWKFSISSSLGKLLLIYVWNFHVLSHLLLIYICKLHWNLRLKSSFEATKDAVDAAIFSIADESGTVFEDNELKYFMDEIYRYEYEGSLNDYAQIVIQVIFFWFTYVFSMS